MNVGSRISATIHESRLTGHCSSIHRFDERCFSPRQATFIKLPITCIIPDTCTALFILFSISRSSYFLIIIIMQWTLIYVATHSLSQAYPLFVGILCIKYPVSLPTKSKKPVFKAKVNQTSHNFPRRPPHLRRRNGY